MLRIHRWASHYGLWAVGCWLALSSATPLAGQGPNGADSAGRQAIGIPIEGMINPLRGAIWMRKFDEAVAAQPDVIVLLIDSPGGYVSTTMQFVEKIERTPDIEVVAFIQNEAISGAALLALSADRIIIAEGAQIGDAGLIVEGPDSQFRYADAKARSALVSQVRTIAETAGRPPALAEAMVDKDAEVFVAVHKEDGRQAFFTEAEWKSLPDADQWRRGKPVFESKKNRFLTLSGRRAVELGLANASAEDVPELTEVLEVRAPIAIVEPSKLDGAVVILNDPIVTGLLLILGFGALLFELSAPGIGIGGIFSTICFGTFFWSRFLGGSAGWLEVLLFLMGLFFIGLEFFVIPGFGVAGVTGGGMLIVSLVLASRHVVLPESSRDLQQLGISVGSVLVSLLACIVIGMVLISYSRTLPGPLGRLALQPPRPDELTVRATDVDGEPTEDAPAWALIEVGMIGRTLGPLRPAGRVQFGEHVVDVITEGDFIDSDCNVRVHRKSGTRIIVRTIA